VINLTVAANPKYGNPLISPDSSHQAIILSTRFHCPLATNCTALTVCHMRNRTLAVLPLLALTLLPVSTPASAATTLAAPTSVTASARPAAVAVTFTPTGSITNYEVRCVSTEGVDKTSKVITPSSAPFTEIVTELKGGLAHSCVVRSILGSDSSVWVTASPAIVTPTKLSLPAIPTITSIQPLVGSARIRFNGVVGADSYLTRCALIGKSATAFDVKTPATPGSNDYYVTVLNLAAGEHSCWVQARNNAGSSKWAVSSKFTPLLAKIASPTNVNVIPGDSSAVVSFTLVPGATGYQVSCISKTGKSVTLDNQTASPVTVSGLTNGVKYLCSVLAMVKTTTPQGVNIDTSAWASASEFTPATPRPAAPLLPVLSSLAASTDYLTRTAAITATMSYDTNGGTPSSYTLRCTGLTDPGYAVSATGTSPLSVTVPAERSYSCVATAANNYGISPTTAPLTVLVPVIRTAPDAVKFTMKRNKDYSATVSFKISSFPAATGYRVTCSTDTDTRFVPTSTTSATLKLPLGLWGCTTSAIVNGQLTAESVKTIVAVAPPKPGHSSTSSSIRLTRPSGWTGSWLASCRSDIASAARAGKLSAITLDLPRGVYECRAYVDGVASDPVAVKV